MSNPIQTEGKGNSNAQKARTTVTDARNAQVRATTVNEATAKIENPLNNVRYVSPKKNGMRKAEHIHKRDNRQKT